MTRLLTSISFLVAAVGLRAADPVPRYHLEFGQELRYRTSTTMKYGEGKAARERVSRSDWTAWVVRANSDGSFRVVIRQEDAIYQLIAGKKHERPAAARLVYADVFPDGRVLRNDTIASQGHPGSIFPRLPKDLSEAAKGWSWTLDDATLKARPVKAAKGFRFEAVTESPSDPIFLTSRKMTYTFDAGRITAAEIAGAQGYGINSKWTGVTELLGVKAMDPSWVRRLAAEEGRYFEALAAFDKAANLPAGVSEDEAKKRLEAAGSALKAVKLTHPLLKGQLEQWVKGHEQSVKFRAEEAGRQSKALGKVIGKAAEPFSTKDMEGKTVKLADLKGKVVVLDFWFRGCGWCIKAMPQVNGLAEDFAGKPVVILGMNTDEKEEDARVVIEKLGLKYPTLRAAGLAEKFGVEGMPTVVVIDQDGKIRDVHVGYSPTLREDVGRWVRTLLDK